MTPDSNEAIQVNLQFTMISKKPLSIAAWHKTAREFVHQMFAPSRPAQMRIADYVMVVISSRVSNMTFEENRRSAVVHLEYVIVTRKSENEAVINRISQVELVTTMLLDTMDRFIADICPSYPEANDFCEINWNGFTIPFHTFDVEAVIPDIELTDAQIDKWLKATNSGFGQIDEAP